MITFFFHNLIYLTPLNLFFYTWRFLSELEQEESNAVLKRCLRWFSLISIVLLPLAFYCIVPAYIVEYARSYYYYDQRKSKEYNHYNNISNALFKTIEILCALTNLISCSILTLVIRLIYKLSKRTVVGREVVQAKNKVNAIMTASHVGVTLAFTISQTMLLFSKSLTQNFRMQSAFTFFGGLAEMFLSVILWFILDSEKTSAFYLDGDRLYAITEVISARNSGINIDCNEELEQDYADDRLSSKSSNNSSFISKRMIEQFFNEIEEPDRDWKQDDHEMFADNVRFY